MSFISLFPSFSIFVLFLFVVVIFLHLLFVKKTKLFINFVALYISFALVIILPLFIPQVATWLATYYWVRAVAFLGLYILLGFVFHFSNLNDFSSRVAPTSFVLSLVYRIGVVGLIFTTVLYFLPGTYLSQLGLLTRAVFGTFTALICWFFVPIILAFAYRFKTRRGWIE
ncbi:MAG: hypothetical protein US42_C0001G0077 [Candidatus Magasanikbacteria bacterium GW2011_GWC2_37_14]|uniref:Uncharacterized protein n=1 Tax=Candidatus Magasanikbacteria bacterium GW2011_GWC2_37_14 TaxID=1619046 RepID=A0A0G0JJH7_9BACT|nr:MAG: hypothetical protein US42_C0001G0077 [Candidatus Magasanikbacteria bacterium GW2011_GWC2_37_14]